MALEIRPGTALGALLLSYLCTCTLQASIRKNAANASNAQLREHIPIKELAQAVAANGALSASAAAMIRTMKPAGDFDATANVGDIIPNSKGTKKMLAEDVAPTRESPRYTFAYYMQVYEKPAMVKSLLEQLRKADPVSPVFILSDAGLDFSKMAKKYRANFTLAGRNQMSNHDIGFGSALVSASLVDAGQQQVKPSSPNGNGVEYLLRIGKVMRVCDCKFVVVLEEDTCVHHKPRKLPRGDIGGVPWTDINKFGSFEPFLKFLNVSVKTPKWGRVTGACGGSYYRVSSMLAMPEVSQGLRSDLFVQLSGAVPGLGLKTGLDMVGPALAYSRGLRVIPWEEINEIRYAFDGSTGKIRLPRADMTAFEHKCAKQTKIDKGGAALHPSDQWMVRRPTASELARLPPDGEF